MFARVKINLTPLLVISRTKNQTRKQSIKPNLVLDCQFLCCGFKFLRLNPKLRHTKNLTVRTNFETINRC